MTTKITIIIILIFGALLFSQEQDTTKAYKNTAIKESETKKIDAIEKKLWDQNRQMDKLNKKDTIK